ncbi:MAG: SGNH/GDSL hydrolase family protein [Pirellulaceae bacterium]
MKKYTCLAVLVVLVFSTLAHSAEPFPRSAKRIVFLGDSITHAGYYVTLVEAHLRMNADGDVPELINLGLPSETCNGMSEPEHPFPRPNVQERIDRALAKLKPDVVVVCYGMNDGIYYPPTEKHFAAYRKGIDTIIAKVHASGAKLILMTPPAFDALPLKQKGKLRPLGEKEYSWKTIYENYDDVIKQFAAWIQEQSGRVEMVIDLHGPITDYTAEKRKTNSGFTMSEDGVHVNNEGHQVLANAILKAWGVNAEGKLDPELLKLISTRQTMMKMAWLSEVGHLRPGVKAGLPIEEAKQKAAELDQQIAD